MSNKRIFKVGIAGYGIVGKVRHKSLNKCSNIRVVAICDKNFKTNSFKNNIHYFTNYKRLLKENIDILIVCLTNQLAPIVTLEGLKKNCHVFCEKPPGINLKDIHKVLKEEKKRKYLKLMYGFNHRYHDSVKYCHQLIKSKKYGNIISLRGIYGKSKLITFNQTDWRTKRKSAGGGILLDQGIHMIDLVRLFGGSFDEIYSSISNSYWNHDVEDNAYVLMKNKKNNVNALIHSSATQWNHKFRLEINLEKGNIILDGILTSSKSYGKERLIIINKNKSELGFAEKKYSFSNDQSWDNEINYFVSCIINNKKIIEGNSHQAFNTMKLIFEIYYSDIIWRKKYSIQNPKIYNIDNI